eukprot:354266-Chlamydomonas_euryale.AAC.8
MHPEGAVSRHWRICAHGLCIPTFVITNGTAVGPPQIFTLRHGMEYCLLAVNGSINALNGWKPAVCQGAFVSLGWLCGESSHQRHA